MVDERLDSLENWRDQIDRKFSEAFPASDHIGHCRYHQLMIDDIEARRGLRKAVMEKTISGLVWSVIVGLALATWAWIKQEAKS